MKIKSLLVLALFGALSLHAQISINLSGTNTTCNAGSVEVGENAVCGVYNITNNTGSTFNVLATPFVAQAYPFVWDATFTYGANYTVLFSGHTWESLSFGNVGITPGTDGTKWADRGTAKYVTVAADGDARWRTWGESFNPSFPSSSSFNPASFPMANGATGQLTCYVAPHKVGAVTGHCYLISAAGSILSTITASGTGLAVPQSGGATLPTGCVVSNGQYDCSAVMDTTYVAPSSCSTTVTTGAGLTAALAAATSGQTICLSGTITGNFTVPKISGTAENKIITSQYASLPASGNRVGPSNASVMAKVQDTTGQPVFTFADGAHNWRITGLEITSTAPASFLIAPTNHSTMYSAANLAAHNVIDRNYLHTSGTTGGFGILMDGSFAVLDNYIDLEGTDETQGINFATSNGPIVLRNNYTKAVGENILGGGADSRVLGAVPQDVVIQGNYVTKPLTWDQWCTGGGNPCSPTVWDGVSRSVKNLMELKKGVRVLIDSNIFANNWVAAQDGSAILMEPANQSGSDLDVSVKDITFTNNIVHDSWGGFNHVSSSYAWPSRTSKHWTFRNNLFYNLGSSKYGIGTSFCIVNWSAGASSWFFRWNSSPTPDSDVWIQHNTCLGDSLSGFFGQNITVNAQDSSAGIQVNGWNLKNNLLTHGTYGLIINGTVGTANAGLAWNGFDNARNLFIGANPGTYNSDFVFTPDNASVKFANAATNDYRLCTASGQPVGGCSGPSPFLTAATDGTQYGANVAQINALTSCVISGTCAATQNFSISPTAATVAVNGNVQFTTSDPASFSASSGTIAIDSGLFTAPATPSTSTITATQLTVDANDLNTQSNWLTCGNCGDTGGSDPTKTPGTFTLTAGNPATFSAQPGYPFNNGFWYYVLQPAGAYNLVNDYILTFDMQFPTQAAKNASQAVEFELQKGYLDNQYNMAWQICFACGNKLRIFNKVTHAWDDSGLTFDPTIFAGGKWVTVTTVYHLTTGNPGTIRHVSISLNGVNHVVNIDHQSAAAVEGDYLHPAFQLDTNSSATPYSVLVRNFDVYTPTATTATATVTSIANTISPNSVSLPVQGKQQFSYPLSASWTASAGSVSPASGLTTTYTAPNTPATATISATSGSLNASAIANVLAFTVSPATSNLNVGGTQQFSCNFACTYSVNGGTISSSGLYTAPQLNGTYTITATAVNGGATATASVVVTGQLTFIPLTVSPLSWTQTTAINTTITKAFTVSNIGSGSVTPTVALTGSVKYSISANTCTGALAGGGNCTVTVQFLSSTVGSFAGTLTITDTAGGSKVIPIQVSIPTGTVVTISPTSATLPVNGVMTFSSNLSGGASPVFSTNIGSINISTGAYTAPNFAGTGTVTATANDGSGSSASATVTVVTVAVNPVAVTMQTNSTQQFSANVPGAWSAGCGSITQAGLYTAPAAPASCSIVLTASNGGATGTANVIVQNPPATSTGGKFRGGKHRGTKTR